MRQLWITERTHERLKAIKAAAKLREQPVTFSSLVEKFVCGEKEVEVKKSNETLTLVEGGINV